MNDDSRLDCSDMYPEKDKCPDCGCDLHSTSFGQAGQVHNREKDGSRHTIEKCLCNQLEQKDKNNKKMRDWIGKHLVASCPDGYCDCTPEKAEKCKTKWINKILKDN